MGWIGTPDKFVDPNVIGGLGNGSSWANAWSSIDDITGLAAGNCIAFNYAATDTITTGFTSATNGTVGNSITIYSADPSDNSYRAGGVIDGNSAVASAILGSLTFWNIMGVNFSNFTGYAINSSAPDSVFIDDCVFENNGGDIFLDNDIVINRSTFLNSSGTSVDTDAGGSICFCYFENITTLAISALSVSVYDCVIGGTPTGISLTGNAAQSTIKGNTIYDASTTGVSTGSYYTPISENLFSTCGTALTIGANNVVVEDYNVFYNNTTTINNSGRLRSGGNSVTTGTNPLTDPANKDYSRVSGTSVIGASKRPGAQRDATIQSFAYVTAGLPPELVASGGGGGLKPNFPQLNVQRWS